MTPDELREALAEALYLAIQYTGCMELDSAKATVDRIETVARYYGVENALRDMRLP